MICIERMIPTTTPYADLHCHTLRSDGSVTPEELVRLAAARNLPAVAVTDHDTLSAGPELLALGQSLGVQVVPGVEISTKDPKTGRKAHILLYGPKKTQELGALCDEICRSRQKAGEEMLEKTQRHYPIPREIVQRHAQWAPALFKQHIMLALISAGYADVLYGPLFRELFDSKTGLAYSPVSYPNVHEALEVARASGGVAVLAHPSEYGSQALLGELAANGEIHGVEVWHPRNRLEELPQFQEIAQRHSLLMTGGTDFHGANTKRCLPLGSFMTPEEQWNLLAQRL